MTGRPERAGARPAARRHQERESGFTLVELLVVVAIIGIITAVAIPQLQRALFKARIARLAADAKTLHAAFTRFGIDNNLYPSTSSPRERALNTRTLDPLVAQGYLKNPSSIVSKLVGEEISSYDSPNVGGPDTEFWAVLIPKALPLSRAGALFRDWILAEAKATRR